MQHLIDQRAISLQQDYVERLRSLVSDGYIRLYQSNVGQSTIAKLKHRSNGRVIILTADYANHSLRQTTNGLLKHIHLY